MPTVLCIDDRTYGSKTIQDALEAHGYEVVLAPDAQTAIEMIPVVPVDAVVLDCHKDGVDGGAFVEALRAVRPRMAVVMLSAYCGASCRVFQLADACVQRGENVTALVQTLELVMRSAKYGACRVVPNRRAA